MKTKTMKRSEIKIKPGDYVREVTTYLSLRRHQLAELVQAGNKDRYKANKEIAIYRDIKDVLIALQEHEIDPHQFPDLLPQWLGKKKSIAAEQRKLFQ